MKTVDFIQNIQEQVLNGYGLEVTRNRHIDCFICEGKKKLRIGEFNGNLRGICVCGTYSLFDLLSEHTGKDFRILANEIDRDYGNAPDTDFTPKTKDTSRRDAAIALFRSAGKIAGTDGEAYLHGRGIYTMPTGGVKFGGVYDHGYGKHLPAMIALASNEFSEPKMLHTTYVVDGKKARVETARKMHGLQPKSSEQSSEPIAIKLFKSTDVLGIAEGIESALSAHQLYKCPTWSVMNTSFLKRFRAPAGIRKLFIFADNDKKGAGLAAAMECGHRNILSKNDVESVLIRWPEVVNDFNDVITEGGRVIEWEFRK